MLRTKNWGRRRDNTTDITLPRLGGRQSQRTREEGSRKIPEEWMENQKNGEWLRGKQVEVGMRA